MKKAILITGASDGIGRAIAVRLSRDGHEIILCGRNEKKLSETAKLCSSKTVAMIFDINDSKKRNSALKNVKKLDVLINNAGIWQKVGDLESVSEDRVLEVINTNLTSQIMVTKQLLPHIKTSKGQIVNIISKSGFTAQQGQAVYTASKYGMRGFTDVLRQDLKESGVRVSAVYQSGTNTEMFKKAGDDFPIASFTEPEDLADVIACIINAPNKTVIYEVKIDKN